MIDLKYCIEKGLIRKVLPSRQKAVQSISKAKELLQEAEQNLEENRVNSAVIVCYLALFHSARALLFKDGYREKSHECIIRYVEEKYVGKGLSPIDIQKLEKYKMQRTHTQYDISYTPSEEETEKMLEFAKKFAEKIEQTI